MDKLKPCPFCGSKEIHVMDMGYPHWIYCMKCGAKVHGGTCSAKESIEAWNRRAEPKWISVSERLPYEMQAVNVTWKYNLPEPQHYYSAKEFPFVGTAIYYNGKWYWDLSPACNVPDECEEVDNDISIIAWMLLPEPYRRAEPDQEENE